MKSRARSLMAKAVQKRFYEVTDPKVSKDRIDSSIQYGVDKYDEMVANRKLWLDRKPPIRWER